MKSGLFVEPRHFRYFVNRNASKKQGVVIPDKVTSVPKDEAKAKGYVITTRGEVVITDRLITPEVKFDKEQARLLGELQTTIMDAFVAADKNNLSEDWLDKIVYRFHHPLGAGKVKRQRGKKRVSIYDLAEEFLEKKRFSEDHTDAYRVFIRDLARYEEFKNTVLREKFTWNIDKITRHDLEDFEEYLRNEKMLSEQYPKQFEAILAEYPAEVNSVNRTNKLKERGGNTIIKLKKKFKAFMQWLYETEKTTNRPFDGIKIGTEKYGIPYYISKEERNFVAGVDLQALWENLDDEVKESLPTNLPLKTLEVQRDIFVFQCLVGCRFSDYVNLTYRNITNGILEYIPSKTSKEVDPVHARIPLKTGALELLEKYKGVDEKGRLFPFISSQKYNVAIKAILKICGITRYVPVLDSITGEVEMKRICDVASSHMARRTFVGAAYKAVRDPNIVGKMSGHVEGSRAFSRYRQIDDDILRDTIDCI